MKKINILFLALFLSLTAFAQENEFSVKMGLPFFEGEHDGYSTYATNGVLSVNLDMVHYFNKRDGLVLSYSNVITNEKEMHSDPDNLSFDSLSNVNRGFVKEFRIGYKAKFGKLEERLAFTIEPLIGISYYKTPSYYIYSHYTLGSTTEHIVNLQKSSEQIGLNLAFRPSITYLIGEKKDFGVMASVCFNLNNYGNIWHALTFTGNDFNSIFYADISLGAFYVL